MRGMDLNAESEARNNRVERPERGRRARGNSLPRITVRTKRELVARLEKTWMKNVENYWSTLEDECLAAKEWYDYHAQLYLHKSENEILGSGGQAVAHKEPHYETFASGVPSVFSTVVTTLERALSADDESLLTKQVAELKHYCSELEKHNDRLMYELLRVGKPSQTYVAL